MTDTIKKWQLEEMVTAGVVKQFEESDRQIYYVSKFGNFYSQSKINPEKIKQIKLSPCKQGYLRANINGKTTKVHIVVAETFIRKRDRAKGEVVNHLDSNRLNNDCSNLEVVTQSTNIKKAWDVTKERRRLTPEKAERIRELHQVEGLSYNAIGRMMDCSATSVRQIILGITFTKKIK
ncbi:HNH endonuclease [Staphylococcus kloosii]|uniref:HNH endonuclease n=1 Tax=Staphylococcus kloosii TaxID=29384 RepID=UPI00189D9FE7|nr:HNH endonuclease [Staphylococcus kloosii]MBF7025949.1 HNH endonuclease [Staphylococcus kloosii]